MSLRALLAIAALAPLAACMSAAQPVERPMPMATMSDAAPAPAPLSAGPGERVVWTCLAPDIGSGWQFGVIEQQNETGSELVLASAGTAAVVPLARRSEDGLERYVAGPNLIDIAPDGSARLSWAGATHAGQCQPGEPV